MDKTILVLLGISVLIAVAMLQLSRLRRKTISSLQEVLYLKGDSKTYFRLLDNPHFRLLFAKGCIEHFRLEGYLYLNDEVKIEQSYNRLKKFSLSKGERLDEEIEMFSYWCNHGKKEEAHESLKYLRKRMNHSTNEKNKEILDDAERIYRIYILKDTSILPELKKLVDMQKGKQREKTMERIKMLQSIKQGDRRHDA